MPPEATGAVSAAVPGRAGADVPEGPVERTGGHRVTGSSVCVRDPDANFIEFITYPDASKEHAHVS